MEEEYIQFNSHQVDVRARTDSLARAVFIIAGGGLSISIGIFTNSLMQDVDPFLAASLKVAWWCLAITIVSLVLMLFTIITRDYFFAETWRQKLQGKRQDVPHGPGVADLIIWLLATIGLVTFIGGFLGLAFVATSVIGSR
ncbi:hypothetical protein [Sedimenticola selenatireducens]|uniref:hypothetical protein n=1 Tax=Sedimenticola selenatireducens TaxID=191960 RepID=UPI000565A4EB|nr:hypothetical protein [Sedimenticola selenatireducens]